MKIVAFVNENGYKQLLSAGLESSIELVIGPHNRYEKFKLLENNCTHKLIQHVKKDDDNFKDFVETIRNIEPDLILSNSYSCLIPSEIFKIAKYSINIHGAILPKYQGCATEIWAFLNYEKNFGVTAHILDEHFDTGEIVHIEHFKIEDVDTAVEFKKKKYISIVECIKRVIEIVTKDKVSEVSYRQNRDESIYWKPYTSDDLVLNSKMPITYVNAMVKAFFPSTDKLRYESGESIDTVRALNDMNNFYKSIDKTNV